MGVGPYCMQDIILLHQSSMEQARLLKSDKCSAAFARWRGRLQCREMAGRQDQVHAPSKAPQHCLSIASGAPGLCGTLNHTIIIAARYWVKKTVTWQSVCMHAISKTQSQDLSEVLVPSLLDIDALQVLPVEAVSQALVPGPVLMCLNTQLGEPTVQGNGGP